MAININVQVARSVPRINDDGLTMVIFKNAQKATGITDEIISVNTLAELYSSFDADSSAAAARELYVAEYLVRAGVNLLCYSVPTVNAGVIDSDDIDAISDLGVLNYKMLVVPYAFITDGTATSESLIMKFAKDNDVQLFMDVDPNASASEVSDIVDALETDNALSPKLELFINTGLPNFTSEYADLIGADFGEAGFFGIPASAAAVSRKALLLNSQTPWLPVAGETYGKVNEFTKLHRKLSTTEKVDMQAENLNVLFTKIGVGNLFVSQNTMLIDEANPANPLIRSHVVTTALYVKRLLRRTAEQLLFAPNTIKTWNQFTLKATSLLGRMFDQDGLEDFSVNVGRGITMTEQDIADGKFKAAITFLPVRVIESITFNIVVQETQDAYVVNFEGGDL